MYIYRCCVLDVPKIKEKMLHASHTRVHIHTHTYIYIIYILNLCI